MKKIYYYSQFQRFNSDSPENLFMAVARGAHWVICEEFCKIFNLSFAMCIEFAGDTFLRLKKTRYALQCYNIARVTFSSD